LQWRGIEEKCENNRTFGRRIRRELKRKKDKKNRIEEKEG